MQKILFLFGAVISLPVLVANETCDGIESVTSEHLINENINDLNYTMKINNVNSFTVLVHYYNVLNVYIGTQNFEYDINKVDSNNEYYKSIFQIKFLNSHNRSFRIFIYDPLWSLYELTLSFWQF